MNSSDVALCGLRRQVFQQRESALPLLRTALSSDVLSRLLW